jgi:hypothetical protein
MFRISYKHIILFSIIGVMSLIILNLTWQNNVIVTSITAVIGSIFASVIISIVYQNNLHDSFQTYEKIGIRNTFRNFEEAFDDIKKDIGSCKNADIFFMFGSSFINSSSSYIKDALSNKSAKLRFFIFDENNPFIESYGEQWSKEDEKYNAEGIKKLIKESYENIQRIYDAIDEKERGALEIYKINNSALSYSFYKIDSKLYYIPAKLTTTKLFKHPVFLFEKSNDRRNLYNSIENEIDTMINNNEIIKIHPK